jgi:hypothetical protein
MHATGGGAGGRGGGPILVVYYARVYPLRVAVADHLYAFRRYAGRPCFYLNAAEGRPVRRMLARGYDLVVFHTTFLSQRWDMPHFRRLVERVRPLHDVSPVRVALPQDEFLQTDGLCEFLREFDVTRVFSVMPDAAWPQVYAGIDPGRVRLRRVLTGYLEDRTLDRIRRLAASGGDRPLDIGYRAWHAAPWLGRHGMLKADLAEVVGRRATEAGLRVDISTADRDVLLGDDWYRFLLRCKYTLGVEGGASILDRDGSLSRRTETFLREHPGASFAEVEQACFPGADGAVRLVAISPRHLEACATRTCQVLVEGEYNGILQPGQHYLSLKPDFSNLEEVLDFLRSDSRRAALTEQAYADIVASGRYRYRGFVATVLEEALGPAGADVAAGGGAPARLQAARARAADGLSIVRVRLALWVERLPQRLPSRILEALLACRRALRRLGGARAA